MTVKQTVKLTQNFEHNLEAIEQFLDEVAALQVFGALLDALETTVIPNLERFPEMGRVFAQRTPGSVEATVGLDHLRAKLKSLNDSCILREYLMDDFMLLYVRIDNTIYLLSIKHHRQLSFDFLSHWPL